LLTNVQISYQPFVVLPFAFAENCKLLSQLSISYTELNTIDHKSLHGLKRLQYLTLSNNKITCIPTGLFDSTPVIEQIDVSSNNIEYLHPETFKELSGLNHLDLNSNPLKFIPAMDFKYTGMTSGISIYFEKSQIYAIDPTFVKKAFRSRTGGGFTYMYIHFLAYKENATGCMEDENKSGIYSLVSISDDDWVMEELSLENCYNNWTEQLQNFNYPCSFSHSVAIEPKIDILLYVVIALLFLISLISTVILWKFLSRDKDDRLIECESSKNDA
jgi:Leucine-rich repeat (LRR) protein